MCHLAEIEAEVKTIAQRIGATDDLLPAFGFSRDMGYLHVEIDYGCFHLVGVERGQETVRRTTAVLDELMYFIFDDVTFQMASKYEVKNRVESQDSRLVLFKKQIELMTMVSNRFGEKLKSQTCIRYRQLEQYL